MSSGSINYTRPCECEVKLIKKSIKFQVTMKQEYVYTTPENLKQNLIIKPYKYTTTPTFSITEISDDEIKNILVRSTNAEEKYGL